MSKKHFILILILAIIFTIFTINFSPTKSLAQNNQKGIMSKVDSTLNTIKAKVFNLSNKLVKKNNKNSPTSQETTNSSNSSSSLISNISDEPILNQNDKQESLQIIAFYEGPYIEAVGNSINPYLESNNFEFWDDTHAPVRPIFNSISERYKNLPAEQWPIIVLPTANYQAINNLLINEYPEPNGLNIVMPYISGSTFPNNYNTSGNYKIALVGGGYALNDWTRGNKLDFIDSVEVQYVDPDPQINYDISSISTSGNSTKIYNSVLPYHVRVGWMVWLNLQGSAGTSYQRYNISEVSTTGGYITVNSSVNIGNFSSGTAHVNYLSGTATVIATKLKQIMNNLNCTFPQALEFARATASNHGIRNNETGFGKINVGSAIKYGEKYMSANAAPTEAQAQVNP